MQIRKTLAEISAMFAKQSGKTITFMQTAPDKIRARYLADLDLTLAGHGGDYLLFDYHLGWGAALLAKTVGGIFGSIRTKKLTVDTAKQTVRLNLAAFAEFRPALETRRIAAAWIEDGILTVDLADD
ncbi:hypothetical protein [Neisseria chenwenguii]|uniref:hypothetical protein n=1 Tax=Neisseria chenwenguii TaxID=1853278 RepID=UPI000F4D8574|nr:hypothetical protein [Neisseria chenwenguii]ROV56049.1 hypothetical protein EGS38_06185 [Neisseria chenwenguii]